MAYININRIPTLEPRLENINNEKVREVIQPLYPRVLIG